MSAGPPPILPSQLVCARCGYNLTGATIGGACPECGTPIEDSLRRFRPPGTCGLAVLCAVLGLGALMGCVPLGPVAIWLYFTARRAIDTNAYAAGSTAVATVGLVGGVVGTALAAMWALVMGLLWLTGR